MKYLRIPYSTSTSMLIILGWSHIGSAADITMTDEIEKIEVRHARQPYRGNAELTSLPQSISFVSEQLLKDTGVTEFNDTLNFISGAAHQNNFGGLWDSFALRGFSGDENLPSSYLINGFSAGRGFSGNRDVSNIANIEIWKGPTSALYGRGEPGGTINIVTKKPQFEQQGYLQLSAGKFDTYRLEADYTNAISDNIAFRLNGSIKDAGSFRDAIQSKKLALTPSVSIKLSDKTHINYEMEFIDQQTPFDRGVVVLNNQETLPASRFLGEENDGPMNVEATGHQLVIQHDLTNNWFISAGAGYRESSLEGFSSDAELSSGRQLLYVDGTTLTRQRRYRDYDAKDLSARVELSGETELFNLSHSLLFGADFYDYELHSIQHRWRTAWGSGDDTYSINIYAPKYGQSQPTPSAMTNRLEEQFSYGFYVQDQIDISDKWKATLGGRFDKFEQDISNYLTDSLAEQSQSKFSPRLGAVYTLTEQITLYGNYATGFRPNSGADYLGETFEPEKSTSLEAGIKLNQPQYNLTANAALFSTKKSNVLTSDPVNSGFSAALGEAESKGVELDVSANITDDTQLSFSYAYIDAKTANDMVNLDWGVDIPAGSRLINIPKNSANLTLQHYLQLASYSSNFGLNIQYVGNRLGETIDPDYILPHYTLVNIFANIDVTQNLALKFNVNNLFDHAYYISSYSALWTMPGKPLSYQASLRYSF